MLDCRFCLILSESRGELDYDIIKNGRYHYQTMRKRPTSLRIQAGPILGPVQGSALLLWCKESLNPPRFFVFFPLMLHGLRTSKK